MDLRAKLITGISTLAIVSLALGACGSNRNADSPGSGNQSAGASEQGDVSSSSPGEGSSTVSVSKGKSSNPSTASTTDYPTKPVKILVAYAPGGGMDVTARILAKTLGKYLGVNVTVSNVTGGGGATGYTAGATARPDGYTLTLIHNAIAQQPAFLSDEDLPYGPDAWKYSYMISSQSHILTVNSDSDFKSAKDVIEAAKPNGPGVTMGLSGHLASQDVARAILQNAVDVTFKTVYFDGGAPAVTALLAGDVQTGLFFAPEVAGQVEAGKLRLLATTASERTEQYPDLPTMVELGYDVHEGIWRGLAAPKGTPDSVMQVIDEAMAKVVADADWKAAMKKADVPVVIESPDQFTKTVETTSDKANDIAPLLQAGS